MSDKGRIPDNWACGTGRTPDTPPPQTEPVDAVTRLPDLKSRRKNALTFTQQAASEAQMFEAACARAGASRDEREEAIRIISELPAKVNYNRAVMAAIERLRFGDERAYRLLRAKAINDYVGRTR